MYLGEPIHGVFTPRSLIRKAVVVPLWQISLLSWSAAVAQKGRRGLD